MVAVTEPRRIRARTVPSIVPYQSYFDICLANRVWLTGRADNTLGVPIGQHFRSAEEGTTLRECRADDTLGVPTTERERSHSGSAEWTTLREFGLT